MWVIFLMGNSKMRPAVDKDLEEAISGKSAFGETSGFQINEEELKKYPEF